MRLSEALDGVGRPIAYLPALAKFLGGVKAGILFCQLYYWSERTDESGWFWKRQDELRDETGLTIDELRAARKELAEKGILESEYRRLEHRLYFKIDRQRLDDLWLRRNGHVENPHVVPGKIPDGDVAKVHFGSDPEITAQTTNREGERDNKPRTPTPASKNGHQKPKTAWPENLELTPEMVAYAEARGIDAKPEFEAWRPYCLKNDERYADWDAAWEVWIRRAQERAQQFGSNRNAVKGGDSSPYHTGAGERLKREQEEIERERAAQTPEQQAASREAVREMLRQISPGKELSSEPDAHTGDARKTS